MLLTNAPTYLDQCRDPDALRIDLEELEALEGPALLTFGDRRPPLFRRIVELVAAAIPGAMTAPLPGAAHDPQVTHRNLYARLIEDFICRMAVRP